MQEKLLAKLSCAEMHSAITTNRPGLPTGGRLETALTTSKLDGPTTLIAIAYLESLFDTDAVNNGNATGLYQFTVTTADDVQDRVVKNFLPSGTKIPNVPAQGRFKDYRKDAAASSFCAWAYLLDRIASQGNKLREGIISFGDQTDGYATKIFAGIAAIRSVSGSPADQPTDAVKLATAMKQKCAEVRTALNKAYGY